MFGLPNYTLVESENCISLNVFGTNCSSHESVTLLSFVVESGHLIGLLGALLSGAILEPRAVEVLRLCGRGDVVEVRHGRSGDGVRAVFGRALDERQVGEVHDVEERADDAEAGEAERHDWPDPNPKDLHGGRGGHVGLVEQRFSGHGLELIEKPDGKQSD